jgi:hypothetical protein
MRLGFQVKICKCQMDIGIAVKEERNKVSGEALCR